MKRISRKIVASLLVLTMIMAFSACSNDQSQDATTVGDKPDTAAADKGTVKETGKSDSEETGKTEQEETPAEVEIDPYPAFDLGGRTIKVGIWWDYYYTSEHNDIKDDQG